MYNLGCFEKNVARFLFFFFKLLYLNLYNNYINAYVLNIKAHMEYQTFSLESIFGIYSNIIRIEVLSYSQAVLSYLSVCTVRVNLTSSFSSVQPRLNSTSHRVNKPT